MMIWYGARSTETLPGSQRNLVVPRQLHHPIGDLLLIPAAGKEHRLLDGVHELVVLEARPARLARMP